MAAADFEVDVDALGDLGKNLLSVHTALVILPAQIPNQRGAIGSPKVSGALDEFATNWTQDYEVLRDDTKFLSDFAVAAAAAYRSCESGVTSAFQAAGQ